MEQSAPNSKLSRGLFIAASVVQILTCVAHTIAQLAPQDPPPNEQQKQLMDLMKTVRIDLPGAQRTFVDLFNGFGWHFSFSLLAMGVIGMLVTRGDARVRRVYAGAAAAFMAVLAVNSMIYFFLIPTAFMGLATVLYAAAFVTAPKVG